MILLCDLFFFKVCVKVSAHLGVKCVVMYRVLCVCVCVCLLLFFSCVCAFVTVCSDLCVCV